MMYPSVITREEAIKKIARLNCIDGSLVDTEPIDLVIAEYLRKTLCNLAGARDQGTDFEPIYITRLTNTVRRQLEPLWPDLNLSQGKGSFAVEQEAEGDINPDPLRRVLKTLDDIRDVMEIGNGYWLPTPIRLIHLPEKDKVFVVGGVATADLLNILGMEVKHSGFIRYVERSSLPEPILGDKTWWQSYEDWVGDIPKDLRTWTKMILAEAKQRLRPSASDFTDFEVYFPLARIIPLQFFRWIRFKDLVRILNTPPNNLVLCRTVSQRFQTTSRKYWLGNITLTALKNEAPILPRDVRRLQYGLDLIHGAPTQAVWEPGGVIVLRNWLPQEERRLLLAFGQDVSAAHGRLPLKYRIEPEWQDFLTSTLENIGIQVIR